jgi:hypothetical protein
MIDARIRHLANREGYRKEGRVPVAVYQSMVCLVGTSKKSGGVMVCAGKPFTVIGLVDGGEWRRWG